MKIEKIDIKTIKPLKFNPRIDLKPEDEEYQKIKKSILEFDLVEPFVVNKRTGNLISGHQRLKILKELGKKEVEAVIVDLSKAKEKALNLALNKITGKWDYPRLKDLLIEIDTGEFDIETTGFTEEEIEELITKFAIIDIDKLLEELDMSQAIDKPLWAVIRTDGKNQEILEKVLTLLEERNIKVERSYEI